MSDDKHTDLGETDGAALSCVSMIAVLERMLEALDARMRPIQEEMQVVQQLLADLRSTQFLAERRQQRAAVRQAAAFVAPPSKATLTSSSTS